MFPLKGCIFFIETVPVSVFFMCKTISWILSLQGLLSERSDIRASGRKRGACAEARSSAFECFMNAADTAFIDFDRLRPAEMLPGMLRRRICSAKSSLHFLVATGEQSIRRKRKL